MPRRRARRCARRARRRAGTRLRRRRAPPAGAARTAAAPPLHERQPAHPRGNCTTLASSVHQARGETVRNIARACAVVVALAGLGLAGPARAADGARIVSERPLEGNGIELTIATPAF